VKINTHFINPIRTEINILSNNWIANIMGAGVKKKTLLLIIMAVVMHGTGLLKHDSVRKFNWCKETWRHDHISQNMCWKKIYATLFCKH